MPSKTHSPGADWVVGRVVSEDGDVSVEFTEVYLKKFAAWIITALNDSGMDWENVALV